MPPRTTRPSRLRRFAGHLERERQVFTALAAAVDPEFEPATVADITAFDGREVIAEVDGQELHGMLWIEGANGTAERALLQVGLDVQELDPEDVAIRRVRRR